MKKLVTSFMLVFSMSLTSSPRANAAAIIGSTPVAIIFASLSLASAITEYAAQEIGDDRLADRMALQFHMTGFIALLDSEAATVFQKLEERFPTLPFYVLEEASLLLASEADKTSFNDHGFKSVTLSLAQYEYLESLIGQELDSRELSNFKVLLTTDSRFVEQ